MSSGSIARRYAKALLAIGEEKGNLLGLQREVQRAADVWTESEELSTTLMNSLVELSARRAVWIAVTRRLGVSPMGRNFLNLLFDKKRLTELPVIAREFGKMIDKKDNRLRAEVISAKPLPDVVVSKLKGALQQQTGKVVVVTKREDSSLIGGVVTKVGDLMFDGSVKTQLVRMKENMLSRG